MRNKVLISSVLGVALSLTACGGGSHNSGSYSNSYGMAVATESAGAYDYYYDDGYYDYTSSTYINSDNADYNYTFSATGETKKTKNDMLSFYESVQDLVNENDGYIESVDNNYTYYTIDDDVKYISDSEKCYKYSGNLRFVVQIPNANMPLILDTLESFCNENSFNITAYNQRIQNYEGYVVVNDYVDIDWDERDYKINEGDLEHRLKYAELSVAINYRAPRNPIVKFWLGFESMWLEFWDNIGEVVVVFLALGVGFAIIFFEWILLYKAYRRMIYKHRMKKPQYYQPKEISLITKNQEEKESV